MATTCYICKKEIKPLTIKVYSKEELIQNHSIIPEGMTSDDRICFRCRESSTKLSDEQAKEQERIEKAKEPHYSTPIISFGSVILIIGLAILFWSFGQPILVAGQYMILAVIVMAIGGYVISKSKKQPKIM